MHRGVQIQGARNAHAHRTADAEGRAIGTEIHPGPRQGLLTPVHEQTSGARRPVDLQHQIAAHQIEGVWIDSDELGTTQHRLESGVLAEVRQLGVTGAIGRGLASSEHGEVEGTIRHTEADSIRITETRQSHLTEIIAGTIQIQTGPTANEQAGIADPHRQQISAQHPSGRIRIRDTIHHRATELDGRAAINHLADAERHGATDQESGIGGLQVHLRGLEQHFLGPVHETAIDHGGLALLQQQVGGDHVQRIHTLELRHTKTGLESGVFPNLSARSHRQHSEIQATTLDPETGGSGIVRLRQGHLAEGGAGRLEVEAGSGADVQVGLGHGEAQQVAAQTSPADVVWIHDPGHSAATDRHSSTAIHHIRDADSDRAADLQAAIRRSGGHARGIQRRLGPIHQFAASHRRLVQLQVQVGTDDLERIHTLELGSAQGGAETGELTAGGSLSRLEDAEIQRAAFHRKTDGIRVVRSRQGYLSEISAISIEIERSSVTDIQSGIRHAHRQQVALEGLGAITGGIHHPGHPTAADAHRGAAIHHLGDTDAHRAPDQEALIGDSQAQAAVAQRGLHPVKGDSTGDRGLVLPEYQIGGDDLEIADALQLGATQSGLDAHILPRSSQKRVGGAGIQLATGGENGQPQAAALDGKAHGVRIIGLRQGHRAEPGIRRNLVQAGPAADEDPCVGNLDGQQVALQHPGAAIIRIVDPLDGAAAHVERRAGEHHVGDGQTHRATDLQCGTGRGQRQGGFAQHGLSPIQPVAIGHRGAGQGQRQVGRQDLDGIDSLQLSLA